MDPFFVLRYLIEWMNYGCIIYIYVYGSMDLWILDVPYLLNLLAIYLSPGAHGYRYTNRRDAPLPGPSRLRRRRRWRRWRRGGRQADGDGWHMEIQGEEVASADWWFHIL